MFGRNRRIVNREVARLSQALVLSQGRPTNGCSTPTKDSI